MGAQDKDDKDLSDRDLQSNRMTTTTPPPAGRTGGGGGNAATLYRPESVFPVPGTHTIMTTCKQCSNTQIFLMSFKRKEYSKKSNFSELSKP